MNTIKPYRVPIWQEEKEAGEVGQWPTSPALFLPVTSGTLPVIRGLLQYAADPYWWRGTEQEIEQAVNTLQEQGSEYALEAGEVLRVIGGITNMELSTTVQADRLSYRYELSGQWSDWFDAGPLPPGPEGPPGQVQAGFWYPRVYDNGDGTATVTRQWYCRTDPHDNVYEPDGPEQEIGIITGPVGPQGPEGPQGPQGPQGPEGEPGDYFLITATNPDGDETIQFLRTRIDGTTGAPLGGPIVIGGVVAAIGPQGPEGPQGPQGPQGPAGPQGPEGPPGPVGTGYHLPPPTGDYAEFDVLGAYARHLVEAMSTILLDYYDRLNVLWHFLQGAASMLPSMPAFPGIDISVAAMLDPIASSAERLEIAKSLYCDLVPYRDLSDPSIAALAGTRHYAQWQTTLEMVGHVEAVKDAIKTAMQANPEGARSIYNMLELRGEVDPTFDYTTLPCTPNLGTWQRVYDFTTGQHGWTIEEMGTYVPGEGFQPVQHIGSRYSVFIGSPAPTSGDTLITHIEIIATDVLRGSVFGSTLPGLHYRNEGAILHSNHSDGPLITLAHTPSTPFHPSDLDVFLIYMANNNARIVRVSVTGEGEPLPGGTG